MPLPATGFGRYIEYRYKRHRTIDWPALNRAGVMEVQAKIHVTRKVLLARTFRPQGKAALTGSAYPIPIELFGEQITSVPLRLFPEEALDGHPNRPGTTTGQ